VTKKLDKAADALLAEWHRHPVPSPYKGRIQPNHDRLQMDTLLRELVDLVRDNAR